MIDFARIYFIAFGLITIAGGVQGAMKGSMISLIAGGILGLLAVAGGYFVGSNLTLGLVLALVGALGVAGKFVPAYFKTHALWPAGTLGLLGVICVVVAIAGFVVRK